MKKASRVKRKTEKEREKLQLTYKDFTTAKEGTIAHEILLVMNIHRYEFKVKRSLYQAGIISPETFLFTDEIYRYLGYKEEDGSIILNDTVLDVLSRKVLADQLHAKGSFLFSLLVELDDNFYTKIKEQQNEEEMDLGKSVPDAITEIVRISLDATLMKDIENDPKLKEALDKKT